MILKVRTKAGPGSTPAYGQIAEHLRREIRGGRLADGKRLPTVREMAKRLGVSRDTVAVAYEALAAEGLVESTVGRGTFVRAAAPSPKGTGATPPLSPLVERLLERERARPRFVDGGESVPLHAIVPDPSLFPLDAFRKAIQRALRKEGGALLAYGPPQGHRGLREAIAARLRALGVEAGPDEVVLCQGASEGISLALRLFASPGDAVAVEDPTYGNVLSAVAGLGLVPVGVPMGEDGPDLAALEQVLARPEVKVLYTIPTFHNPLGTSTSVAHRRALLEIAARLGKPVVEDAYEIDLRYEGRPVPPLAALDRSGLVLHLSSFSKALFPGVRVGWIVARGRLVDALLAVKRSTDLGGSTLLQAALAEFLGSGAFDRHLARLRRALLSRRKALLEALAKSLPAGTQWTTPDGGYQVWVELPEGIDTRELLAEATKEGVQFSPGDFFRVDGRPSRALRLSLATADEAAIRAGVAALGRAVRERMGAGRRASRSRAVHV
jgi:DNA-binding transcriptional MocR family regulator